MAGPLKGWTDIYVRSIIRDNVHAGRAFTLQSQGRPGPQKRGHLLDVLFCGPRQAN